VFECGCGLCCHLEAVTFTPGTDPARFVAEIVVFLIRGRGSDASREQTSPADSGYGAWAIVGDTFVYVEGRWSLEEVTELDINTLELAAMNIGSFTIMAIAICRSPWLHNKREVT
jgi:hypothetical protein